MDLVTVARDILGQLCLQPRQFTVGRDQIRRHVATTSLPAKQHTRDRIGIQLVRFRSQSTLLRKLMGLTWMQQAELVASAFQKAVEIFSLARGGLQADQNLLGRHG